MKPELPVNIPKDWRSASLAELSDFITKGTTPTTLGFSWTEDGVLFLRSECVSEVGLRTRGSQHISAEAHNTMARSAIQGGDLLVTITGNVGRVCIFPNHMEPANINQHIARIRILDKDRADSEFFLHVLSTREYKKHFEKIVTGLAYPQLSLRQIRETRVPLPPLPEQRKIAAILSSVDATIEKTEIVIEQLQIVKKAMMHELLTRGLPGRHSRFKNTELGELPSEWKVVPLSDLINQRRPICYGILKPGQGHPDGVPVIKVKDIKDGRIDDTNLLLTSPEIDEQYHRSRLRTGDVLLTIRGTTGKAAIVPSSLSGANITQDTARLSIRPDASNSYIYYCLQGPGLQQQIAYQSRGQAVKGINIRDVRQLKCPFPKKYERRGIVRILKRHATYYEETQKVLNELRQTKLGLQSALVSGAIRVQQ